MKNYLLLLTFFLFFGNAFAENKNDVKEKFNEIAVTLKDGQKKSGKIKQPYDLNKKIEIVSESGSKEKIDQKLIDEVELKTENGLTLKFKSVHFKNAFSAKISKKPKLLLIVMEDLLTLYYDDGISTSSISTNGINFSQHSFSYVAYYAIREGEEVPTFISYYLTGKINANAVFKKYAAKYFEDYPELSKKIEDKVYKYTDLITVCVEYINWKKSKE